MNHFLILRILEVKNLIPYYKFCTNSTIILVHVTCTLYNIHKCLILKNPFLLSKICQVI